MRRQAKPQLMPLVDRGPLRVMFIITSMPVGGAETLLNHNIIVLTALAVLWGFTLYAYFGLYPTYLREALKYTPPEAGKMMSFFGIGALTSIGGGWLGDRYSPRNVLVGAFAVVAVLGYLLFHDRMSLPGLDLSQIPFDWLRIGVGAVIFMAGFLLFTGLLVTIGAATPTAKEAGGFFGIVMILIFGPLYAASLFVSSPHAGIVQFLGALACLAAGGPAVIGVCSRERLVGDP